MTDVRALITQEAVAAGLDPDLAFRVAKQESGLNPGARSPAGAIGVMQLMPGTARDLGVNPHDTAQNIRGGVRYLKQQLDEFGTPELALAAYNAGPAAVRKHGGVPPYAETQGYVGKIMGSSDDIFGFSPPAKQGGPKAASDSSDDIFGFGDKPAPTGPKPRPLPAALLALDGPPKAAPRVSTGTDMAKGAQAGAVTGLGGMIANNPVYDPIGFLGRQARVNSKIIPGLGKVADVLEPMGASGAMSRMGGDYRPETLPGKLTKAGVQFLPAAVAPGSAAARTAAVAAPAVGSVVGREGVKAAGGGETAQAIGEGVGGLLGGVATALKAPKIAPKAPPVALDTLRNQKNAAYKAVDDAGVTYKPGAVDGLIADVKTALGESFDEDLHTGVKSVLKKLDKLAGQPVTLGKLDQVRQYVAENVLTPTASKGERRLGHMVRDTLDDFVAKTGPQSVEAGTNPEAAAASIVKAREINTRLSKAEQLQGAAEKAQRRTAQSGNGGNINNNTRSEVGKVMDRRRDWTPDEKKALEGIVLGGKGDNVMRSVGKLSPSGNGLQQSISLTAAAATHGLSLPISAAGMIAKGMSDRATVGKVEKLVQQIASGGQGGKQAQAQLGQLAKQNPKVPMLASDTAKRMLTIGGLSLAASAPAVPAAAQRQQSRR